MFAIHLDVRDVVLKDGWDIDLFSGVLVCVSCYRGGGVHSVGVR